MPFVGLMLYYLFPYFLLSFRSGEMSSSAGGLIIWPAKAVLLVGFILLAFQGISEIIKKIAVMRVTWRIRTPSSPRTSRPNSRRRLRPRKPGSWPKPKARCRGSASMIEFIAQNMAPIMFASLIIFLLIGYPVAFALAANGLLFFFIGVELAPFSGGSINLSWPLLYALPNGSGDDGERDLLAIPFFNLHGHRARALRHGGGPARHDRPALRPVRGGLAYAVILVGALLAATTGVVAASVIAMGLISLPIMLRYGYDRRVAAGTIAASGTLAQIIPPSLVLIVLADQLGRSVGDMYKGALIPGLVLTGMYMGYILSLSIFKPNWVPALPKEARTLAAASRPCSWPSSPW